MIRIEMRLKCKIEMLISVNDAKLAYMHCVRSVVHKCNYPVAVLIVRPLDHLQETNFFSQQVSKALRLWIC